MDVRRRRVWTFRLANAFEEPDLETAPLRAITRSSCVHSAVKDLAALGRQLEMVARFRELPFPFGDHDGRQAVADDVDHRARHVHQLVDAEDECHPFERQAVARERAGEDDERGPRNAGIPLLVSISVRSMVICWPTVSSTPTACATNTDASDR